MSVEIAVAVRSAARHVVHLPAAAPPSFQPPPRLRTQLCPILGCPREPPPTWTRSSFHARSPDILASSCTTSAYCIHPPTLLRTVSSSLYPPPLHSVPVLWARQLATMNAPAVRRAPAFVALGGGAFRGAAMVARPAAAAICGAPVLPPVTAAPLVVGDGLPTLGGDVTMRCRRNLKLEKRARNRANGRTFKKSKPRFFNRRSAVDTTTDKDTEFLSSIFNVLTFDARSSAASDDRKKGGNKDRRPRKD